ncbi:MAG: hypothetical protein AAF599_21200, partial [Bacteroidota bacterium]
MKIALTLILFLTALTLSAQDRYYLIGDQYGSSIASAENLLTVHLALYSFQDRYIKNQYWEEDTWQKKSLGVGYRLGKTILLDVQMDWLVLLAQHEVFGHGYRARSTGTKENRYRFSLLFPYGSSSGAIFYGRSNPNRFSGFDEGLVATLGGNEANAVLAKTLRDKWLLRGAMHYRELVLYSLTLNNHSLYAWSTKLFDRNEGGNDMLNYIRLVNARFDYRTEAEYQLTFDEMSNHSLLNFVNTYQLFALYAYFKGYLLNANESFDLPMFRLKNTKYLPTLRVGMTPFGSEFILENHFLKDQNLLEISWRQGDGQLANFYGGGVKWRKVFPKLLTTQIGVDFWNQPSMLLGGESQYSSSKASFSFVSPF